MIKFKTTIIIGILINFFVWLFFSYDYFNKVTQMSGEINLYNGHISYSTLELSRIGKFILHSNIIDKNGYEIERRCSGETMIEKDRLLLEPFDKQKGCIGEYFMKKVSEHCFIIRSTRLKTLNHTFFVCKN
ncbi:hypothetical protein HWQ46_02315 [Shewanella sp. D64]|uniref:hypothetical protein n=1 Tax=unclassified Shewanella TaxID=196818 RepID=UPI0022BA6309|nr:MULTISPECIES: hypothetical protein [unclassified Shewanella]MEC4724381.1 hypothetical protein [Shewanella sp. D64]MEC4738893.1 hypothetical protein [Shewanella sp. E94]WBJ97670.1 hypothetical protein HWQ47_11540 [Shewanella sp. MTB7]